MKLTAFGYVSLAGAEVGIRTAGPTSSVQGAMSRMSRCRLLRSDARLGDGHVRATGSSYAAALQRC